MSAHPICVSAHHIFVSVHHISPQCLTGTMLQKLRLMLNLENIALQRNLALIEQQQQRQQHAEATEDASGNLTPVSSTAAISAVLSAGGKVQAGMLQAVRAAARSSTALTGPVGALPPPLRAMGPAGQAALVGLHGVGPVAAMQLPPLLSASGSLAEEKALWTKRLEQVQTLLSTVSQLHSQLTTICEKPEVSWHLVKIDFDDDIEFEISNTFH